MFFAIMIEFCLGMLFLVPGLDFIFAPTVFRCDKLKDICYREYHHFWSKHIKRENICTLSDVKKASIDPPYLNHREGLHLRLTKTSFFVLDSKHYIILELKKGSCRVFNSVSNFRSSQEQICEEINKFLKDRTKELSIKEPGSFFAGLVYIYFSLSFLAFVFTYLLKG